MIKEEEKNFYPDYFLWERKTTLACEITNYWIESFRGK